LFRPAIKLTIVPFTATFAVLASMWDGKKAQLFLAVRLAIVLQGNQNCEDRGNDAREIGNRGENLQKAGQRIC